MRRNGIYSPIIIIIIVIFIMYNYVLTEFSNMSTLLSTGIVIEAGMTSVIVELETWAERRTMKLGVISGVISTSNSRG